MRKRGKGRITGSLTTRSMYTEYCKETPVKKRKIYQEFRDIIKDGNILLKELLLQGEEVKFPFRLGNLYIGKRERDTTKRLFVDYKKSKEVGFRVYHEDEYGYKCKWDKRTVTVHWKSVYSFLPCRQLKRDLASAIINDKMDYAYLR